MSPFSDIKPMSLIIYIRKMLIKTPRDIGALIRKQRKALGYDQAELAKQIGASRKWIIDLESGKQSARLDLVLKAINAVGLILFAETRSQLKEGHSLQRVMSSSASRKWSSSSAAFISTSFGMIVS